MQNSDVERMVKIETGSKNPIWWPCVFETGSNVFQLIRQLAPHLMRRPLEVFTVSVETETI